MIDSETIICNCIRQWFNKSLEAYLRRNRTVLLIGFRRIPYVQERQRPTGGYNR